MSDKFQPIDRDTLYLRLFAEECENPVLCPEYAARSMAQRRLRFRGPPRTAASLCFSKALQSGCYKPLAASKKRVSC